MGDPRACSNRNFNVKGEKLGMWDGDSGVGEELGCSEFCSKCEDLPGVVNAVSTHGDVSTVGFCFLWAIANNNLPMSWSSSIWNIMLANEVNGIGTR